MFDLRNTTIKNFGYDTETAIDYTFNSLGYRSESEFDSNTPIVIVGNTISFGLGLPIEHTFAGIIEKNLNYPVYNFSWGCYGHTNLEQLSLIEHILSVSMPKLVIFQLNNWNRYRMPNGVVNFSNSKEIVKKEFDKFLLKSKTVLQKVPHIYLHWDEEQHEIDLPNCLIYNKFHIDSSLTNNKSTFGKKTHKLIATALLKTIL
jgi:hypothetical protein